MKQYKKWFATFQAMWRWKREGKFILLIDAFDSKDNVKGFYII